MRLRTLLLQMIRQLRGGAPSQWIEVDALAGQLKARNGVAVIDVRGPDEFTGPLGHIGASLNIPLAELPGRLIEINALKDQPVILVCRTDKRSASAATQLRDAGFRDVHVLRGGMERWNQKGLPVEGRARPGQA